MAALPKTIRIETNGPLVKDWRIFLDGSDVSRLVRNLRLEAGVDIERPKVFLELVGYVELPIDIQALVEATQPNPGTAKKI